MESMTKKILLFCGLVIVTVVIGMSSTKAQDQEFDEETPEGMILQVTSPATNLQVGETIQLTVQGFFPDGTIQDLTSSSSGTAYTSSAPGIAEVNPDGLVRAFSTGLVTVFVSNTVALENPAAPTAIVLTVSPGNDSDGDGLPDDFEVTHGLNPNDPGDSSQDADSDELTNLEEFELGTNPRQTDTDADGIPDGEEFRRCVVSSAADSTIISRYTDTDCSLRLNENCIVSVLNRTARVRPDGGWGLPNLPTNTGQVRVRATCVENGVTRSGQSDFFALRPNSAVYAPSLSLRAADPIPESLSLNAPETTLATVGATTQLVITARFPGGSTKDVTAAATGTNYTISNSRVATLSPDGLVTAVSSGVVVISAMNDGAVGFMQLRVALTGGDSDGDGIPDDVETANGLNPNDPTDGFADADNDGLTNKQELIDFGTNPRLADSDNDGISDGEETRPGADGFVTNPLLVDTDGDGVSDGVEVSSNTDPTNPSSRPGFTTLQITPADFVLTVNAIIGEAFQQLTVTGRRADGSTVDLTAAPGTSYTSSDLTICNFLGSEARPGRVFAGSDGACTITVTNGGLSAQASVTVRSFAPTALAYVDLPDFAHGVDVSGNFAYVATTYAGLQVVDVTDRRTPRIVAALDTPGWASNITVVKNTAFVADAGAGLQIIDVTNPLNPVFIGAVDTPGDALDVVVKGNFAFVADGPAGLQVIDISDPTAPRIVGAVDTPGRGLGVDVDNVRLLAVVADGNVGDERIQVIDIADLSHPTIVGQGFAAFQVVLSGNVAFVAPGGGNFSVMDLSTPNNPVFLNAAPVQTGGGWVDVAVNGRFALGADIFFVNAIPIIDVSIPADPVPRAIIDFSSLGGDDGTSIAVDNKFAYRTGRFTQRLYIGQYLDFEDSAGIPPSVSISSPTPGESVAEGITLPISVEASDDVAVASVDFLVNGIVVFTDTTAPYQFDLTLPQRGTTITLGARAIDFGDNPQVATEVAVNTVADSDGDRLTDDAEINIHQTSPTNPDTDGDGLSDWTEVKALGTSPTNPDMDGDGLSDGVEVNIHRTSPTNSDTDSDGLNDAAEVNVHHTDPTNSDTDFDGLSDGEEINVYRSNPNESDTDGDGLYDYTEATVSHTNLTKTDTDDDGLSDQFEVTYGLDPLLGGDGAKDPDKDGLDNLAEQTAGTAPIVADSDVDTFTDGTEVAMGTSPTDQSDSPQGVPITKSFLNPDPRLGTYVTQIDPLNWTDLDVVRQVRFRRLVSILARRGTGGVNSLTFIDPATVNSFQAKVFVQTVYNAGAFPQARLAGAFYNDGTPGSGFTGDIVAGVGVYHNGTELLGFSFVVRCTQADCATPDQFTFLHFDDTTYGNVTAGVSSPTLAIAWDGRQFTFKFDSKTVTFDPTVAAPIAGPPRTPFKGLQTVIAGTEDPEDEALIEAHFSNVEVDLDPSVNFRGLTYDDFSSGEINPAKWKEPEVVRQSASSYSVIAELGSGLTSTLDQHGVNGGNSSGLVDANAVNLFQADVAVTEATNNGAFPQARLSGAFYNDGTPGNGQIGDVVAGVGIGHNGAGLVGFSIVVRCTHEQCLTFDVLHFDDTTFGAVNLSEIHTARLGWDGGRFTFWFDAKKVSFDPTTVATVAGPPRVLFKDLATYVGGIDSPTEGASITAAFGNVVTPRHPHTHRLSARRTFLRTNEDPFALDSGPIDLRALGIVPGDRIRLEQLGDFSFSAGQLPDDGTAMIGIFSASNTLLSATELNRVFDARDAGDDQVTDPTLHGNLPTDIPQDFLITDTAIEVPPNAQYLFVAAKDVAYGDNGDPDGDFAVRITKLPPAP